MSALSPRDRTEQSWSSIWRSIGLTQVRIAIIKKLQTKCWRACGEWEPSLHCWWESKLVQSLWRTVCRFLKKKKKKKKTKNRANVWSISHTPVYISRTIIWKDTCTPVFITVKAQCGHFFSFVIQEAELLKISTHGGNLGPSISTAMKLRFWWVYQSLSFLS